MSSDWFRRGTFRVTCLLGSWLVLVTALVTGAGQEASSPPRSKKGLQVQMVDDALALGIAHAALNVQIGDLLRPLGAGEAVAPGTGDVRVADGWAVSGSALAALDRRVRPLAAADVELNFILLARATGDPALDAWLLDPRYDAGAPNRLGAFRVLDAKGAEFLRAVLDVLARRYAPAGPVGHVRGWIVGNEVNSHWWWYNLGRASLDEVVGAYEPAVRLVHEVVSRHDGTARVYVSLEHHWQAPFGAGDERTAVPGRALLDAFARRAREQGDFPWHVAHHPYPEDLFDCRFWEDESARPALDTPRITFRNLEVLTTYLEREELVFDGAPRRVILSEQGFHCRDDASGETDQAAAFALAWRKVRDLDGVDALIYHRHVDHAHEGGLRFGLWENATGSVADPGRRRPLWELFRVCDTPDGPAALDAALRRAGL